MKNLFIYLVILPACNLIISCNLNTKKINKIESIQVDAKINKQVAKQIDYDSLLKVAVFKINMDESLSEDIVIEIIPKTEENYLIYYNLLSSDNSESDKEAFYKIDELIFKLACENNLRIFDLFINMVEFVDGEYAESYFENVEIAISTHKKYFITIYPNLNKECQRRLEDFL